MKTCNGCRTKKDKKSILVAGVAGILMGVVITYLIYNIK